MKITKKTARVAVLATLVAGAVLTTAAIAAARDNGGSDLGALRKATAKYHDLTVATNDQFGLFKDTAGIACIDLPGVGAMGVHYVNGPTVGGSVDELHPQALVYAPGPNGQLKLAAVEYVTIKAAWDATHIAPPALFGQEFMLTPEGNRFGLPAFYSLHVWVWKHNPTGTFSMWNPDVRCDATADDSDGY